MTRRLSLGAMALGLLLPFLDVEFEGCQKTVATPCEAPPVVEAARELLSEWGPMNILVRDIACPSYGEVDGTLLKPSYSRRAGTLCEDYDYWATRERGHAGGFLRSEFGGLYSTYDDGVGPTRRPRLTVTCTETNSRFGCDLVADLLVDSPPYNPSELERDEPTSDEQRAELKPIATKRAHVDFALETQPAVSLRDPQPLGPLLARLFHTAPAPIELVTGDLSPSDVGYLPCLVLFVGLGVLVRLARYPRASLVVATLCALVGLALVVLFVWETLDACGDYFVYAPERRLYGFFDYLFSNAEMGLLVFTSGSLLHVYAAFSAWRRSRYSMRT